MVAVLGRRRDITFSDKLRQMIKSAAFIQAELAARSGLAFGVNHSYATTACRPSGTH
jgi:hypothetical protein